MCVLPLLSASSLTIVWLNVSVAEATVFPLIFHSSSVLSDGMFFARIFNSAPI